MSELQIDDNNSLFFIHHRATDNNPTFVFVNALTGNTGAWEEIVAPICRDAGFGTLSYNMRGQIDTRLDSESTPDCDLIVSDLQQLLASEKPQNAILCGLSIGGLYAAKAALNGSDVKALVLLNTLRVIGPRLQWINEAMVHVLNTGGFRLMLDMYMPLLTNENFHASKRDSHLQGGSYEPESPDTGAYRLLQAAATTDWDIDYEKLNMPVLTITGLQDRVFYDAAVFEKLASRLPDASHIKWDNAGHLLPAEVPQQLGEALVEFATSTVAIRHP